MLGAVGRADGACRFAIGAFFGHRVAIVTGFDALVYMSVPADGGDAAVATGVGVHVVGVVAIFDPVLHHAITAGRDHTRS